MEEEEGGDKRRRREWWGRGSSGGGGVLRHLLFIYSSFKKINNCQHFFLFDVTYLYSSLRELKCFYSVDVLLFCFGTLKEKKYSEKGGEGEGGRGALHTSGLFVTRVSWRLSIKRRR